MCDVAITSLTRHSHSEATCVAVPQLVECPYCSECVSEQALEAHKSACLMDPRKLMAALSALSTIDDVQFAFVLQFIGSDGRWALRVESPGNSLTCRSQSESAVDLTSSQQAALPV